MNLAYRFPLGKRKVRSAWEFPAIYPGTQRNPQKKEQRPKDKINELARPHLIPLLKPTDWQGNLVGREGKSHHQLEARGLL